ncbi:MAG: histidinol dehydrogenase [Chloroflexi bacterium]|nr:MAG: histidinol dehydrogenase [Chloroflexota bacterium]
MSNNNYIKIYKNIDTAKKNLLKRNAISLFDYKLPPIIQKRNDGLFKRNLSPYALVNKIIKEVIKDGDSAIKKYSKLLDGADLTSLKVTKKEIDDAFNTVSDDDINSIKFMTQRIKNYHEIQLTHSNREFFQNGFGIKVVPIDNIGIYMTGALTALPSSIIHTAIPAIIAGSKNIVGISPTDENGNVNPYKLIAAKFAGIEHVYKGSGAQAIAALAYGTESIPKVDKIAGPGNIFVSMAKQQVFGNVGIDALYGPTETLVIADKYANPDICAADILHAAEHDSLAIPILITDDLNIALSISDSISKNIDNFSRKDTIQMSLKNGGIVISKNIYEAVELSNIFAPEHLCLSIRNPNKFISLIKNAGGIFVGEGTPEVIGDYTGGISHVMPTGGTAKYASPLSIYDFQKIISIADISAIDLRQLGPQASRIAMIEGLSAHANSIDIRLNILNE